MKRLFGLLIIAIVLPATTGASQTVEQGRSVAVAGPTTTWVAPRVQGITTSPAPLANLYFERNEDRQEWDAAMKELREADSESAKADAKNKIEKLLTAQYDEALDGYDKYLEELSGKIAEMKKQVEKRRDARDEMVQLKLLMVVSEAEGLGWPDNRQGGLPSLRIQSGGFNGNPFSGAESLFGGDAPPAPDMPTLPGRPLKTAR